MEALQKTVTKIQANPLLVDKSTNRRLRVAAYCRVSTDEEEQLNSYEAQIAYYTKEIAKNPNWIFAGVYADEGISGTMTKKRKNFLRLMNDCEKGKIDMILTKSISRFARNTVDSLNWVRRLRELKIGVFFEEQNIDSLKAENEMLIGLFSVIAQAESENISSNVKWGIHESMRNGTYCSNFTCYGYKKGERGVPEIVPEQAKVVRLIYDLYLDGYSLGGIQKILQDKKLTYDTGKCVWHRPIIDSILKNEKYVGDLLLQKTYISDPISKKSKINKGELPKYLVTNNHPAIIDRDKFNRVQIEISRRGNKHKKSSVAKTEQGKYSSKFVLSEILVCGECGFHYRRNGKTLNDGTHIYYWRCLNRIENGKSGCKSHGIEEQKLKSAICKCLNNMFEQRDETLRILQRNLKATLNIDNGYNEAYNLDLQIKDLEEQSETLMSMISNGRGNPERDMKQIEDNFSKIKILRQRLNTIDETLNNENSECEFQSIMDMLNKCENPFNEYNDIVVHRLVDSVRVTDNKSVIVTLKGGQTAETVIE